MLRRRQWRLTPVLLPGKSHGWRSLVGCSPWGRKQSNVTERLHFTFHFHALEKELATHSSVLAWKSQGQGSLVGCCLWGRAESDWSDLAAAAAAGWEPAQLSPAWFSCGFLAHVPTVSAGSEFTVPHYQPKKSWPRFYSGPVGEVHIRLSPHVTSSQVLD